MITVDFKTYIHASDLAIMVFGRLATSRSTSLSDEVAKPSDEQVTRLTDKTQNGL